MHRPVNLVVLISGNGSNLQAVLDACQAGDLPARVVAVVSNQAQAYGLERARKVDLPALVIEKIREENRQDYDARLAIEVLKWKPDIVLLAGWMRLLGNAFLEHFPGRVVNLHPALPGTFPGTHAIERSYVAWERGEIDHSGVMVHLVPDEGVDSGPVLGVKNVAFRAGEKLEDFESRLHLVEHALLVDTLKQFIANDLKIKNGDHERTLMNTTDLSENSGANGR